MRHGTLTPDQIRRGTAAIATGRGAIGLALLTAPRRTLRLAGVDDQLSTAGRVMAGLFAVRELVVAAETLQRVREGYPTTKLLRLGALCDCGDALVLLGAVRRRGAIGRLALGLPTAIAVALAQVVMAAALAEA